MKIFFILLSFSLAVFLLASCQSTQQEAAPVEEKQKEAPPKVEAPAAPEPASEEDLEYQRSIGSMEGTVSKETFNADKEAIIKKIKQLNNIMAKKDYNAWLKYIDKGSKTYWSSTSNLSKYSEKLPKGLKGVKLKTLEDYFKYVFIPARNGRQIDEIRYNSENSIKAVQISQKEDGTSGTVVYYNFIKEGGDWKVYLPRL